MIFKILAMGLLLSTAIGFDGIEQPSIDSILLQTHSAAEVEPEEVCDDLQFLRRASLDLIGRVPTLQEIRLFEQNPNRADLVERLIESPQFNRFLAETWTAWLIGYSNAYETDRELFRIWLEDQITNEVSFKTIVESLITANGSVAIDGPSNYLVRHREQPAVSISRSFLGVRLECAQCHDHPFDRWTQDDYIRMNQFFLSMRVDRRERTAIIREVVQEPRAESERPRFLTGSIPRTGKFRDELAMYVTNCKPFARTFANRIWYQLIGRGIVDPPDDHNQENPPVDRQLLEYLAQFARDTEFQIKPIFKKICLSEAYQRGCATSTTPQTATNLFAARQVKPLLPEQYIDSFSVITDRQLQPRERRQAIDRLVGGYRFDEDFQRSWEYRETNQQLMQKLAVNLGSANENDNFSLNELYLKVLTRLPNQRERELCHGKSQADVTFALLFGNEFFFSH